MTFAAYLPEIEESLTAVDGGNEMLRTLSVTFLQLCMVEKHQSVGLNGQWEDSHRVGTKRRNVQVIFAGARGVCKSWKQVSKLKDELLYMGDALQRTIFTLSHTDNVDEFRLALQEVDQTTRLLFDTRGSL